MKALIRFTLAISFVCTFLGSSLAQSGCENLTDPLFGYVSNFEFDPCCGQVPTPSICYDLDVLNSAGWAPLSSSNPYSFLDPQPNSLLFSSFSELATMLTSEFLSTHMVSAQFSYDPVTNQICAENPSSVIFVPLNIGSPDPINDCGGGDNLPGYCFVSVSPILEHGCEVTMPDFSDLMDPNATPTVDNSVNIINGIEGSYTVGDLSTEPWDNSQNGGFNQQDG
ncbi:MAG: hypothetical protein AAFU60_04820, partial [Bacteroidota bacterium]